MNKWTVNKWGTDPKRFTLINKIKNAYVYGNAEEQTAYIGKTEDYEGFRFSNRTHKEFFKEFPDALVPFCKEKLKRL